MNRNEIKDVQRWLNEIEDEVVGSQKVILNIAKIREAMNIVKENNIRNMINRGMMK